MGVAIAALTIGAWFAYSALTGKSLTEVFTGDATPQDPAGTLDPVPVAGAGTATDPAFNGDTLPPASTLLGKLGKGAVTIDGHAVAKWIAAQVLAARQHGWSGQVLSGIRTDAEQRAACIHVCGNPNGCPGTCAKPGTSNHRGDVFPLGAVDVSEPDAFATALAAAKNAGAIKGFVIKNDLPKDRGHFSFTGH